MEKEMLLIKQPGFWDDKGHKPPPNIPLLL